MLVLFWVEITSRLFKIITSVQVDGKVDFSLADSCFARLVQSRSLIVRCKKDALEKSGSERLVTLARYEILLSILKTNLNYVGVNHVNLVANSMFDSMFDSMKLSSKYVLKFIIWSIMIIFRIIFPSNNVTGAFLRVCKSRKSPASRFLECAVFPAYNLVFCMIFFWNGVFYAVWIQIYRVIKTVTSEFPQNTLSSREFKLHYK